MKEDRCTSNGTLTPKSVPLKCTSNRTRAPWPNCKGRKGPISPIGLLSYNPFEATPHRYVPFGILCGLADTFPYDKRLQSGYQLIISNLCKFVVSFCLFSSGYQLIISNLCKFVVSFCLFSSNYQLIISNLCKLVVSFCLFSSSIFRASFV